MMLAVIVDECIGDLRFVVERQFGQRFAEISVFGQLVNIPDIVGGA